MFELLAVLTPIALLDSLSVVPVALAPMAFLLAEKRPLAGALAFIFGVIAPYLPVGLALLFGMEQLIAPAERYVTGLLGRRPHDIELLVQIAIGMVLVVLGHWIVEHRGRGTEKGEELPVSPWVAFTVAAVISLSGLWGALPYFAAIAQILKSGVGPVQQVLAVAWYNLAFTLPLLAIIVLRTALGPAADGWLGAISRFLLRWGRRLVVTLLIGLGAILVADGIGWFYDLPLLPVGGATADPAGG